MRFGRGLVVAAEITKKNCKNMMRNLLFGWIVRANLPRGGPGRLVLAPIGLIVRVVGGNVPGAVVGCVATGALTCAFVLMLVFGFVVALTFDGRVDGTGLVDACELLLVLLRVLLLFDGR